jgi:uncharacterized protein YoaH (UPF0181 family)
MSDLAQIEKDLLDIAGELPQMEVEMPPQPIHEQKKEEIKQIKTAVSAGWSAGEELDIMACQIQGEFLTATIDGITEEMNVLGRQIAQAKTMMGRMQQRMERNRDVSIALGESSSKYIEKMEAVITSGYQRLDWLKEEAKLCSEELKELNQFKPVREIRFR